MIAQVQKRCICRTFVLQSNIQNLCDHRLNISYQNIHEQEFLVCIFLLINEYLYPTTIDNNGSRSRRLPYAGGGAEHSASARGRVSLARGAARAGRRGPVVLRGRARRLPRRAQEELAAVRAGTRASGRLSQCVDVLVCRRLLLLFNR